MCSNATVHIRAHPISPPLRWLTIVASARAPQCCSNQLQPCVSCQTHTFDASWPRGWGVSSPSDHPPDSQPQTPPFLAVGQQVVFHRPLRPRPLSSPPQTGVNLNARQLQLLGPHRHHLLLQLLHPAPAEPVHLGLHDGGGVCLDCSTQHGPCGSL